MKKCLWSLLLGFVLYSASAQTARIIGKVTEPLNGEGIAGVKVELLRAIQSTTTNESGEFILENVQFGNWTLVLTRSGFPNQEVLLSVNQPQVDMGDIVWKTSQTEEMSEVPIIVISESDLSDDSEDQGISGLLTSAQDVFLSTAAYEFGTMRFQVRGYGSEYSKVFMNGIEMNDMEMGRPIWGVWGGLNDVMRNRELVNGSEAADFTVDYIGGASQIDVRPSEQRKQVKASYAATNRTYTNRAMFTVSTGMLENNWAFTVAGSRRWAEEGYVEGSFYDAWSYFFAAEKKLNNSHSLSLTVFGAPNRRGGMGGAPKEVYNLMETNYYNSNWGYQNGEKRNSRVYDSHKPYLIANHDWRFSEKLSIKNAVAFSFGKYGKSYLSWYDALDPRPTYYRNLPYNNDGETSVFAASTQLNWDSFYFANSKNIYSVLNANGVEGDIYTGLLSKYFIEEVRTDHKMVNASSNLNYKLNDELSFQGGISYDWYQSGNFKEMLDLLGGEFWVDIDKFAEREAQDPTEIQNDLLSPNRIIKEGDKFGYDYTASIMKAGTWGQVRYAMNKMDVYASFGVKYTQFYRSGNMQKGLFPDDSYGDSEKQIFVDYTAKTGATYKITGRHFIVANAYFMTNAPYFRNSYVSPRTRNEAVNGLKSETIFGGDLSYIFRTPIVNGRISGYYTVFNDKTEIYSFYHDEYQNFVNRILTNIDTEHVGVEFGMETKFLGDLVLKTAGSYGQHIYTSRPEMTLVKDNSAEVLVENDVVYLKNFYVPRSPQTALNFGIKYNAPKFWWIELNANYFDRNYISVNPARRTELAVQFLDPNSDYGSDKLDEIVTQEKFPEAFVINAIGGKSWKIEKYYISLFANVSNILDDQNIVSGGYESNRFDYANLDVNKFPSNYFYLFGRNYFIMLSFRF